MPNLPMDKGYTVIWSHDLNNCFDLIAGRHWKLHEGEGYPSQDTMIKAHIPDEEYAVTFGVEEEEWGFNMARWIDGGFFFNASTEEDHPSVVHVLQWLYEQGYISEDKYIVEVWW